MPGWLYKAILWAATICLMGAIFIFSAQEGPASDALTQNAVEPVAELLAAFQQGTEAAVQTLCYILGTLLRKGAHLLEYALLGALIHLLLRAYGAQRGWVAILIATLYAATDEFHQTLVPGRLGTPTDVMIDALGAAAGVLFTGWIIRIRRKKHVHDL
ncbi:MAG: VanZ family protein [Clostridia bacterium]|nr:VanZ family protein [Clostridia bacterium]